MGFRGAPPGTLGLRVVRVEIDGTAAAFTTTGVPIGTLKAGDTVYDYWLVIDTAWSGGPRGVTPGSVGIYTADLLEPVGEVGVFTLQIDSGPQSAHFWPANSPGAMLPYSGAGGGWNLPAPNFGADVDLVFWGDPAGGGPWPAGHAWLYVLVGPKAGSNLLEGVAVGPPGPRGPRGPAGGGGGGLLALSAPVAFDTVGVAAGLDIPGWAPAPGDRLLDAWVEIDTPFSGGGVGGAAFVDFGIGVAPGGIGVFADAAGSSAPDLTLADALASSCGLLVGANPHTVYIDQFPLYVPAGAPPAAQVWVSTDGTRGGPPSAATAGAAVLHLEIVPAS